MEISITPSLILPLRVYGTALLIAACFRDRSGLFTRSRSGRDARDEIDLVLNGVEDVLADEDPSLGDVIAEATAEGAGRGQSTRDRDRKLAFGADQRAMREHLGAVAYEPPMLTELGAARGARIDAGLARIAGVWRYEAHEFSVGG
jgi:hypothetical protein